MVGSWPDSQLLRKAGRLGSERLQVQAFHSHRRPLQETRGHWTPSTDHSKIVGRAHKTLPFSPRESSQASSRILIRIFPLSLYRLLKKSTERRRDKLAEMRDETFWTIYELMWHKSRSIWKLAASIIYQLCHIDSRTEARVCESLGFTPTHGKICLNSVPKAIAEKFTSNLFKEF